MSAVLKAPFAERAIVLRTRGLRHGPIARLVSPSDIGELIKLGHQLMAAGLLQN